MPAPSEAISLRWIGNAERVCRQCGFKITNLAKHVGEVRNVYPGPKTDLLCMSCHVGKVDRLIERTRRDLGLQERPQGQRP